MFGFVKKIFLSVMTAAVAVAFVCGVSFAAAEEEEDPLLGVKEGWAWPIVVLQPPEGWDSEAGVSIKYAMRTVEREISIQREAIGGKEVTFMFSGLADASELPERLETWRAMNVSAIVSFADLESNRILAGLCGDRGPSLLIPGGENFAIYSAETGRPRQYLFAMDLPYYARANALAEAASIERTSDEVAVITDILSEKLALGAELNTRFLRSRGLQILELSLAAYQQDQFGPQVREAEADGIRIFTCWLDAMATLSIWQSADHRHNGSVIYYSGGPQQILTDAEGLVIVDKDVPLTRNEDGKHDIINKIRDTFNVIVDDPVTAARAFALAKWVVGAYQKVGGGDMVPIAHALESMEDIPLMDETLSIDPGTHRPKSRKFGVLRVMNRTYESAGYVEVFSAEAVE